MRGGNSSFCSIELSNKSKASERERRKSALLLNLLWIWLSALRMSILANRVVSRFTGQLYFFDVLKKILGVYAMWACAQNRGNFGVNFAPVNWAIIQRDFAFFISPDDEGRRGRGWRWGK